MDDLAPASDGLLEDVLPRMHTGLALVELTRPELCPDVSVIVGELGEHAVAVLVEAAVADVGEGDAGAIEKTADDGRAHARQLGIAVADAGDIIVQRFHGALEERLGIGGTVEVPHHRGEETPQLAHHERTRDLAGSGTAHAVADRKDEPAAINRLTAGELGAVSPTHCGGEHRERILIPRAPYPIAGDTAPLEDAMGLVGITAVFGILEDLGELEIDHAELPHARVVGDVPRKRIVVNDAEFVLEQLEELGGPLLADAGLGGGPAIGRDDGEGFGIVVEEPGHDLAAAGFERLQHFHLVFKTLFLSRAAEGFMNAAVVADLDDGTDAVFGDFHEGMGETGGDGT